MPLIDSLKNVVRSVGTSNFGPAATNFIYSEPLAIPTGYAAYRAYKDENDPYVPKKELGTNILKNFLMAYGGQRLFTDAPALKAHVRDMLAGGAEKLSSVKHQAFIQRMGLAKEAGVLSAIGDVAAAPFRFAKRHPFMTAGALGLGAAGLGAAGLAYGNQANKYDDLSNQAEAYVDKWNRASAIKDRALHKADVLTRNAQDSLKSYSGHAPISDPASMIAAQTKIVDNLRRASDRIGVARDFKERIAPMMDKAMADYTAKSNAFIDQREAIPSVVQNIQSYVSDKPKLKQVSEMLKRMAAKVAR